MWFQSVAKVTYNALKFLDGIQLKLNKLMQLFTLSGIRVWLWEEIGFHFPCYNQSIQFLKHWWLPWQIKKKNNINQYADFLLSSACTTIPVSSTIIITWSLECT